MCELSILNVGEGDTKIFFNPKDVGSMATASQVITDLLSRGFAILIEIGKDDDGDAIYKRAKGFDPKTHEYIIAGVIDDTASEKSATAKSGKNQREKASKEARYPIASHKATAVARTAGG